MNFNTEIINASWLQTIVWCLTVMPLYIVGMMWFAATVEPVSKAAIVIHGVEEQKKWTLGKIIVCVIVIPVEVLILQAVSLIAVIVAFDGASLRRED